MAVSYLQMGAVHNLFSSNVRVTRQPHSRHSISVGYIQTLVGENFRYDFETKPKLIPSVSEVWYSSDGFNQAEFNDVHGAFFDSASAERTEWGGRWCIVTEHGVAHEIDTETIGEFTGLLDKNGKEIYEGDIVAIPSTSGRSRHEIEFRDGCFELSMVPLCNQARENEREVIGNIYENPELLESAGK